MKDFWKNLKKYMKTIEGDGNTYFQIDEKCMVPESIAIEIWKMYNDGEQIFYDLNKEQYYNKLLRQENEFLREENSLLSDELENINKNDPKILVEFKEDLLS